MKIFIFFRKIFVNYRFLFFNFLNSNFISLLKIREVAGDEKKDSKIGNSLYLRYIYFKNFHFSPLYLNYSLFEARDQKKLTIYTRYTLKKKIHGLYPQLMENLSLKEISHRIENKRINFIYHYISFFLKKRNHPRHPFHFTSSFSNVEARFSNFIEFS